MTQKRISALCNPAEIIREREIKVWKEISTSQVNFSWQQAWLSLVGVFAHISK